jgi:GH15 family glucan-1,4-alpha-glucosidase
MPAHQERLLENFTPAELRRLEVFFQQRGTLKIAVKNNGLFAASSSQPRDAASGYQNTWLRDTVMVANYFRERGDTRTVFRTLKTLANYFCLHHRRFLRMIDDPELRKKPGERPHVRFDGDTLREIPQEWAQAQNDALGYALWLPLAMANAGQYELDEFDVRAYCAFPAYFEAIRYWEDPDSGHWEEEEAVHNSSVGVVLAALEQLQRYMEEGGRNFLSADVAVSTRQLDSLIRAGQDKLRSLPYESPPHRRADAALLFLIYPAGVVDRAAAGEIIRLVVSELEGEHGIKRYQGDSYWCQDYKKHFPPEARTVDFSRRMEERNRLLVPGLEAQWCIFDPILSVIYGRWFLATGEEAHLERQLHYFRRSLSQLTPTGQCPELYYIENSAEGKYVPNDHVPLAWTQANLGIAFEYMRRSARRRVTEAEA